MYNHLCINFRVLNTDFGLNKNRVHRLFEYKEDQKYTVITKYTTNKHTETKRVEMIWLKGNNTWLKMHQWCNFSPAYCWKYTSVAFKALHIYINNYRHNMVMLVKIHVYTDTIALSTVTKLKIRKKKTLQCSQIELLKHNTQ